MVQVIGEDLFQLLLVPDQGPVSTVREICARASFQASSTEFS